MSSGVDYPLGETIQFLFTTRSFSTGAPTQLAGTPAVAAYEDDSTTEITSGVTLSVDHDTRTGLNRVAVVATSGNGFESGKSYHLVITAGTVGGVSVVGEVVGNFTIERSAALRPTTAGRTLDVTATGAAGVDWGNVENQGTTVDLSDTAINLVDTATTVTNAVTLPTIPTAWITADGIATDAIGAAELAADAVAEIQSGLATAAALATAQTDLDTLTGADGALLATTQTTGWPANLAASAGQIIKATVDTVTNGHTPTTTEFQCDDITEATTDHYKGRVVIFTSGVLAGQATDITGYTNVGGIGQFTVTALTEAASNNDTLVIV